MTRFRLHLLALPLLLLAFAVLANHKAAAQDEASAPAPAQLETPAPQPRAYLTLEELDALEGMSQEQQQAFFVQRRKENEALSDEDRQAKRDARREAFEALPAADQATIKDRTEQLLGNLYVAPPRDLAAEEAETNEKAAEFMRNLTPAQQGAFDEIIKNQKNWQKKQKAPKQ